MAAPIRVKPIVVFRKPKGCADPIPPTTVGILIIEYRLSAPRLGAVRNRQRVAQSTGIRVAYNKWDSASQKIKGTSRQALADNELLDVLLAEAKDACTGLRKSKLPASPARAKALAQGVQVLDETLLESWHAWHAWQLTRVAAGEIVPDTAKVPTRRLPLLVAWLRAENMAGLLTKELTAPLARQFTRWLLANYPTVKSQSFANKCGRLLSECAACAVERGALAYHPIGRLKMPKPKKKPLTFLTTEQLAQLHAAVLPTPKLRRTRDAFLFICYTGFAHTDARSFEPLRDTRTDAAGQRWVLRPRQKSDEDAVILLLPEVDTLLARYEYEGRIPVPNNSKMNTRLHEIEALCHLPVSLTCHVGRRTCGMLLLDAGMSMEAVSKWLGHASIRTTEQLYATVQQRRIEREARTAGLL